MNNVIAFPMTVRPRRKVQRDFLVIREDGEDWAAERSFAEQAFDRDGCPACAALIPHKPTPRCIDCGGEV
jgi:hypothetical protein